MKQRLDIVPLTLAQFQKYFVAMFEANKAAPEKLRDLILKCESRRDILEAPAWKQYIDTTVSEKVLEFGDGTKIRNLAKEVIIPPGAVVRHAVFGEGQVVGVIANFPEKNQTEVQLPYLRALPDEVSYCPDGKTLFHERFGEGKIAAFMIVFPNHIMNLCYPSAFEKAPILIE